MLFRSQREALRFGDAVEIVARGADGFSADAAARAGLRIVDRAPVFLLSKKPGFAFPRGYQFQFWDDDEAFLDTGQTAFLT